ncbi:hypothetical protein WS68_18735 [Burkholderia sp. TSV86]|nr:hypothetical protein WS68_18735 [Burkholderia sp. TSV86]
MPAGDRTARTGPRQPPYEAELAQAALSTAHGDEQSFAAAIAREEPKNLAPSRQIGLSLHRRCVAAALTRHAESLRTARE